MTSQRGLLRATMMSCAIAVSSGGLGGCASAPSTPSADITAYIDTLNKTIRLSNGTRDEPTIALAYEYHRLNSGNKNIQGSIEKILKDNEISLQDAEDIWTESQKKAQAIIDQGDKKVVEFLTTDQQVKRQQRTNALIKQRDAAIKVGDIPTARAAATNLVLENHADKDGNIKCSYSEPAYKTNPMTYTPLPINVLKEVDLTKLHPTTINHATICEILKIQLLTKGLLTKGLGTIKGLSPLKDWVVEPDTHQTTALPPRAAASGPSAAP